MLRRGAGRLITGPAAFLLAGTIDLLAFTAQAARRTAHEKLRRVRAR